MRWDVYCRVVDHYGDAGVCWRLARTLVDTWRLDVRLWIDSPATLACLEPEADADRSRQIVRGIDVRLLDGTDDAADALPDAVIEAFGCGLPGPLLDAMAAALRQPVWINLEYLSAEAWIDGYHGLPSRDPQRPLTRYFFFPGFSPASGGLLPERTGAGAPDGPRDRAPKGVDERADTARLLTAVGLPAPAAGTRLASLFAYDVEPMLALLDAWRESPLETLALVPGQTAIEPALRRWCGTPLAPAGDTCTRGNVTVGLVPFVSQQRYDRLLRACAFNLVRGEDSFLRAQWARRPFLWQPYRQPEGAHWAKLEAYLERYVAALAPPMQRAVAALFRAVNGRGDVVAAWHAIEAGWPALEAHAARWADTLAGPADLTQRLVSFVRAKV